MSRSGYTYDWDGDNWSLILWRGAVKAAMRGRRGQAFLKEMLAAMDALPKPELIAGELQDADGAVCALGAVGKARGLDMTGLDPDDADTIAKQFGIAPAMAKELMWLNDELFGEYTPGLTPAQRFINMRAEIAKRIKPETALG